MSVLLYLLSWKWPSDYKGVALFLFRLACLRRISNRVVADCCDFSNILEKNKTKCQLYLFGIIAADQAVIVELRNQIHLLKNQHHDQLEQLNRERK